MLKIFFIFVAVLVVGSPTFASMNKKSVSTSKVSSSFAGQSCSSRDTNALKCMVCNIYFEARGQDYAGMVAVGRTVMARVASPKFPNSACRVIYQPGQFSWVRDRYSNVIPRNSEITAKVQAAAQEALRLGSNGYTHYHRVGTRPSGWNCKNQVNRAKIDDHLFCSGVATVAGELEGFSDEPSNNVVGDELPVYASAESSDAAS